jgi:hypothetical protein
MTQSMDEPHMRVRLTVAAPVPHSAGQRAAFDDAMLELSYIAGGVTTTPARGWWHDSRINAMALSEDRILVEMITSRTLLADARRRMHALCHLLGDLAVIAWCTDVSMVTDCHSVDGKHA